MIHSQATKGVLVIAPVSVATNATATGNIDTLGFDYASIDIALASHSASPTVLDLMESNDTNASNFATVSPFTGGTGFTIPTAPGTNASNVLLIRFNVDLKARKRYLRVRTTSGAATLASVTARLSRAEQSPTSDAQMGCDEVVFG